ncbi:YagK/YfjJ domain-containing protein [Xenorhabdus bovienii]|uniref:YagK/YfjJ domain-containing protein n=1 Tax=Xenorhabdus bovienii TaxID=40576 RepID=UPI003DA4DE04
MLEKTFLDSREVNPRIAVFRRLLNQTDLGFRVRNGKILPSDQITTAELLNKLAQDYRSAVRQYDFKKASKKYKRSLVKNLKGTWNYLRHLQSRYSRLLVLRVDLSWSDEHKSTITADMARQCRQKLLRNMKNNPLFRHVLGTVWKLEYAPFRQFHYHMLFLLNGHKAQQDVNLARAFGEYWKNVITEGKGHYYNCNAHKNRYTECGLGKLERGNTSMEKGLLKAVSYLTKIDACARLMLPGNARTFGRGEIKKTKRREPSPSKSNTRPR